ncbi:MAG: GNAT family N-acetyltransferase [Candidatus Accumulibacter sp. UW20]|jgi:ribosomal protein S18 acetylase RimI-like enzyme
MSKVHLFYRKKTAHQYQAQTPSIGDHQGVIVRDFCTEKHLAYVMHVGRNTQEFATGEEIVFWSEETLKNWANEKDGSMIVAVDQDMEVAGFLFAIFSKGKVATIENIHVKKHFRRQGIASRLLSEFEKHSVEAGMRMLRSFCHVTNEAMTALLAKNNYSEGVLTQWYVNKLDFINSELKKKEVIVKQIQMYDIKKAQYSQFLSVLISDMESRNIPCLDSAQVIHGAFIKESLVGLITASIHELTGKATIERIFVAQATVVSAIIESLVLSLTEYLARQGASCVTIHPFIEKYGLLDLTISLDMLGFKRRRAFIMKSKLTEIPSI